MAQNIQNPTREISIPVKGVVLEARLTHPENSKGLIIFSHGSGSSRFSPRNNYVASLLNAKGFSTLLTDLLTAKEDRIYENRFNINLLAERLLGVTRWAAAQQNLGRLALGYFGANTGAASALKAAAVSETEIQGIVSRGGRPDLAGDALPFIKAPVLLLVGSLDYPVIELNEKAFKQLSCKKEMMIVQGATHLFEEQGKLEEVARLAAGWFEKFMVPEKRTEKEISQ